MKPINEVTDAGFGRLYSSRDLARFVSHLEAALQIRGLNFRYEGVPDRSGLSHIRRLICRHEGVISGTMWAAK